jgi:kynurenine formamidase
MMANREWQDEELIELWDRCSNRNRWGSDDELGTLNFITAEKRRAAAALVQTGEVLSLAVDLSTEKSAKNANPIVYMMTYERHQPISALDFMGVSPHGFAVTHLDAVGHVTWEGHAYNGRSAAAITTQSGMTFGSVYAQKRGIFTRGVLLDVAAAQGRDWLAPDSYVTIDDLEAAEKLAGVEVGSGDAIFVRIGLEEREAAQGPEDITVRAGLHAECLEWLWEREVSVYSGDCVERMPYPSEIMPLPLHQVGLASIGLCLLDNPRVEELTATCRRLGRSEFLLTVAPLALPGGTGSPVNPTAVF